MKGGYTVSNRNDIKRRDVLLPAAAAVAAAAAVLTATAQEAEAQDWQPHMQSALASLRAAKQQLEVARHNKGGHRVRAINLVNQAINQVETGIRVGA